MSVEAMKQALEALEDLPPDPKDYIEEAVEILRQAIEQAEKQGQWGASSVTKPEYVAEQKEKTQRALDLMAENARELGLDYEPVQAEKQEPVVTKISANGSFLYPAWKSVPIGTPLYTTSQPQRERVIFSTMLRKMWSGGEVQAWLDENVNKEKNT
jgi:hypothetical protein